LALPVNSAAQTWAPIKKKMLRVVSVGRLVDFKAYNMGSSGIVRACLDRGVDVIWDIYGDGPQYSAIKAEIDDLNLTTSVRLMGELNYAEFALKVAEYDLFVGMGTSALEAAMVGVPTICATVDEALHCYGYLHELPFGNVGELQITRPSVEIAGLIQGYAASDWDYRVRISRQCREAAEKYGMPQFVGSISRMAAATNASPSKYLKRGIAELYSFATESWLAKVVRRFSSKNASVS
jgi:glycosyltransferase involved in cell wall biosynthesis